MLSATHCCKCCTSTVLLVTSSAILKSCCCSAVSGAAFEMTTVSQHLDCGSFHTYWPSQTRHFRRQRLRCAAERRNASGPVIKQDVVIPQVGWMWDTGSASATRKSLKAANIKAKKSLGQNFCTDDNILSDIVTAASVTKADAVIEVGPGTGNLTRHLLATNARVIAVEKDDTLIERLREEFKKAHNLQLHHGDVMQLDLQQLVQQAAQTAATQQLQQLDSNTNSRAASSQGKVKVVANLPYNITKDFLLALLPQGGIVSELSIMIQEEVAQRLVDPTPSRPDYRAMSVITHYYSKPVYRFRIPKEKYYPVPGVDGALVTFKLIPPAKRQPVAGEKGFISLVNKSFSERRKMLRNTLQPLYRTEQVGAALAKAGIRTDARAQDLTVQQFAEVYNYLQDSSQ